MVRPFVRAQSEMQPRSEVALVTAAAVDFGDLDQLARRDAHPGTYAVAVGLDAAQAQLEPVVGGRRFVALRTGLNRTGCWPRFCSAKDGWKKRGPKPKKNKPLPGEAEYVAALKRGDVQGAERIEDRHAAKCDARQREIDERKHTQEILKETTNVLLELIQASPLAIVALDRDHRVKVWNRAAEQLFGWSEAEVIGHPPPSVSEDQYEVFRQMVDNQLQGRSLVAQELRRQRKDGSPVDVSIWTAPLRDAQGQTVGAIELFADISEAKRNQEALREGQAKFQKLYQEFQALLEKIVTEVRLSTTPPPTGSSPPGSPARSRASARPGRGEAIARTALSSRTSPG